MSLSAEASTDANGDKLSYSWMSQDGQTLSGADKAVINFSAPESDKDAQYVVSLTVSDGSLSSTATYTLNVKAKAAADDAKDEPAGDSGVINYPAWSASQSWKPVTSSITTARFSSVNRCRKGHGATWRQPTTNRALVWPGVMRGKRCNHRFAMTQD